MKRLAAFALALALAQPAAAQSLTPPPVIAAHVQDGLLDTADLSWLKGSFAQASPAEKRDWSQALQWASACGAQREAEIRAELGRMGVAAPALPVIGPSEDACATFPSFAFGARGFPDWASFDAAARAARQLFETLRYGARLGAESAPFEPEWVNGNAEAVTLLHATVYDQVYRGALNWRLPGKGPMPVSTEWPLLETYISVAVTREDRRNTAMLKDLVAHLGWPTISRVGKRASDAAWLLAQHADLDPAFQLEALRLMEPLVAKKEVTPVNYAYLYDRVMLKITGRQRFATQAQCKDGNRVPQPLAEQADVDARRASVGLGPLADYLASMDRNFGPCERSR